MSTRTPQSIAAHITTALIPAITTTAGQLGRHPGNLITRLQGCAINLANIDMPAIAAWLHGDKGSMRYYPRNDELATVTELHPNQEPATA